MKCPCKDCITLVICRSLVCSVSDIMEFLLKIEIKCSLYKAYVISHHKGREIIIDKKNAIESGKYLGYKFVKKGTGIEFIKTEVKSYVDTK